MQLLSPNKDRSINPGAIIELATITVQKIVDSGTATPDQWCFNINPNPNGETLPKCPSTGGDTVTFLGLATGSYTITETSVTGYAFASGTGTNCTFTGSTATATVTAATNATNATCVFHNAQQKGHLIVQKTTDPPGDPTVFTINASGTGTITGGGAGSVTDATDKDYEVTPGTYSVAETVPVGWDKTGDTCQNVVVAAGETKTCLLTNVKSGHIIVRKETNTPPGDPSTSFNFTTTGPGYQGFNLTGGSSNDQTLAPDSYSVSETVPMGWIATLSCSGPPTSTFMTSMPVVGPGTATASITLAAGDTVTCTFTNTGAASADLSVTKSDGVTTVTAGDGVTHTYTITASNAGPSNATSVTLSDTWPGGFTRGTTTPSQGTCTTTTGQNFSCSLGTIPAGGSATVTVDYTVPASTPAGPQTNTVTVSSSVSDPNTVNNTATDTNTVATSPPPEPEPQDPIITTVSCNPSTVQVNQPTTCTATVSQVVVGTPITTPTGIARFFADASTTAFATCTLRATATTGVANCSVAYRASTVGVHNITARYPGDSTHEASTTLTPFPVTVVPAVPGIGL